MDPVGPWTAAYAASYNRLAGAAGSGGDFPHHLATTGPPTSPPSTTSQLLLQAGAPPAFNPGGFLSPPPVGYDSVFTPFLHHANQKAHYTQALNAAQHRQAIANSKPSTEADTLRENYNPVHHQTLPPNPAFFDQAPSTWSHQNNAQLPSPFGILPHESVVGSSPGAPGTKLTTAYENFNAAHFAAAQQTLNHINSQLVAVSYGDTTKRIVPRPVQSPPPSNSTTSPNVTSGSSYFQQNPSGYSRSDNPSSQFPAGKTQAVTSKSEYPTNTKAYSNSNVSGPSQPTTKNSVNLPQARPTSSAVFPPGIQDKQAIRSAGFQSPTSKNVGNNSALSSKLPERRDSSHEPTQSSPISYAMMDSAQHRSAASRAGSIQQSQLQQQLLNHQKANSYRSFSSSTGSTPESEYGQGTGHRNVPSDGGYSSSSSVGQNGSDCNNLQRSPLNHSQPSPLGHVTSPAAYPMYHSPMTSMSSPSPVQQHPDQNGSYKQNPSPKVAPHSPLDASVTKPSSVGPVGYSSVITRNDQNYPSERNMEYPAKQCWEGAEQQLRNPAAKYPGYPGVDSVPIQRQRGILGLSERQQAYFDSSSSQHLTDTKGDPMSIVKNLQTLQQQCQAPSVNPAALTDIKPTVAIPKPPSKGAGRRKKSVEIKTETKNSEYIGRVPPPAHLNTNQPQQNGGYSEFERWNLPSSHKMFGGNSGSSVPQNTLHSSGNYANPGLIPHPNQHTPSHSPYYQSVQHLPSSQQNCSDPQNCTETSVQIGNSEVEIPTVGEAPIAKVIVPDVEEELGFLAEVPITSSKSVEDKPPLPEIKPVIPFSNPNSSFMASFIKFLQGEKESSPPPKRKPIKATYIPVSKTKTEINDSKKNSKPKHKSPPSPSTLDFEDDPRYFPLPKDPSSRKLDTSSDSDCDDLSLESRISRSKSRSKNRRRTGSRKSSKRRHSASNRKPRKRQKNYSDEEEEEAEELPRRNTSTRKAKEKISRLEDDNEFSDLSVSGSDQEWTPAEKKESDSDKSGRRRSLRGKPKPPPKVKKPPPSRFLESSDEETNAALVAAMKESGEMCAVCSSAFEDPKDAMKCCDCGKSYHPGCCSLQSTQKLKKRSTWKCDECRPPSSVRSEKSSKRAGGPKRGRRMIRPDEEDGTNDGDEYFPFKSGEFIVVKADLQEEFPPIWRVDGKTLLQKYEPFDQNGEKLYRNISTYSGWTPQNRNIYEKIPVQFIVQSRLETIVKFLRSEMVDPAEEQAFLEQSLNDTAKYQDNFEVYIQTLISQALDSNFLAEIFAEKDEYFLQNVEVIDAVTEERRVRLVTAVGWPKDCTIQSSVATWPCYNVLADLKASNVKLCDACFHSKVHARIILYGQPYNSTTLDGSTPHPAIMNQKDFMICLECIKWVQLYNKLVHQKYIMYIECAKRVAEKRSSDVAKDTTVILNELLADEDWLNKLFRQVRMTWADVEKAEREKKRKLGIPLTIASVEAEAPITDVPMVEVSITTVPPETEMSDGTQIDDREQVRVDVPPPVESPNTPEGLEGTKTSEEPNEMETETSEAKSFVTTDNDTDKIPKES